MLNGPAQQVHDSLGKLVHRDLAEAVARIRTVLL
jgi:hypothetical protein